MVRNRIGLDVASLWITWAELEFSQGFDVRLASNATQGSHAKSDPENKIALQCCRVSYFLWFVFRVLACFQSMHIGFVVKQSLISLIMWKHCRHSTCAKRRVPEARLVGAFAPSPGCTIWTRVNDQTERPHRTQQKSKFCAAFPNWVIRGTLVKWWVVERRLPSISQLSIARSASYFMEWGCTL